MVTCDVFPVSSPTVPSRALIGAALLLLLKAPLPPSEPRSVPTQGRRSVSTRALHFWCVRPKLSQAGFSEPRCKLDQGGPKPPMNVRDFAVDQLAHQNLGALTNG